MLNWLTFKSAGIWYKEHAALSYEDAMICISKMMSGNPARSIGIYSNRSPSCPGTGSIEIGKLADLVVVKHDQINGAWKQQISGVMVKGNWVFKHESLVSTH